MKSIVTKRENFISCRATHLEKEALIKIASLESRKPSEMMRELIREGMKSRGLDISNSNSQALNKTGGNHQMEQYVQ